MALAVLVCIYFCMRLLHRVVIAELAGGILEPVVDWLAGLEDIEMPTTYVPPAPSTSLRILVTLRGSASLEGQDGSLELSAGSLALLAPGWAYRRRINVQRWHVRGLLLRGPWADLCARFCTDGTLVLPRPPPAWRHWVGEAAERVLTQDRGWDAAVAARLASLAEGLVGLHDPGLVACLTRAVDAQPERRWSIAELAHEVGLGESGFAHRFRRDVGVPPARWLLARRVAAAKRLLATHGPVEVASLLGFATSFHFSRVFRRLSGETPSAYRARLLTAD